MDRIGTYRGYVIELELYSNEESGSTRWHAAVQIRPIIHPATEPRFAVQPSDDNPGAARSRAVRVAKAIIDERPNANAVHENDLPEE